MDNDILRIRNRLDEIRAFRVQSIRPLGAALFRVVGSEPNSGAFGSAGASAAASGVSVVLGDPWPSLDGPVRFTFDAQVPEEWSGSVRLQLDVGGEALLRINGRTIGGLTPNHGEFQLEGLAGPGDTLRVEADAMPYGPFGSARHQPALRTAALLHVIPEVDGLFRDLEATHQVASAMAGPRPELAQRLLDLLQEVVALVPIPRWPSETYLAQMAPEFRTRATPDEGGFRDLWERWEFGRREWRPDQDFLSAVRGASILLHAELDELRAVYPPQGRLEMVGHTHIDLAWLWPLAETRRKVRRSFATVLQLMEWDSSFRFAQASPQVYAYLEEDDPDLFEAVRERVKEGRWELLGGMWVEPDGNLPSGESWVRQLLHGQQYFQDRFGRKATVGWLPDTFGYAGNLPQVFRSAGLTSFFTTKLTWNETNRFPHDLYWWEGIDGSRILTHSFRNPDGGYNGTAGAESLRATWENFGGKRWHDASLYTFGYGDGGGGPTEAMLHRTEAYRDFPGMPRTKHSSVGSFFADVDGSRLPTWRGEQYLEFHRATFTAQAAVKARNRQLERSLREAEVAAVVAGQLAGGQYPRERLNDAWTVLLRNQFHDILPGSSVRSVYSEAEAELTAALAEADDTRRTALGTATDAVATAGASGGDLLVVWNLGLHERPLVLRIEVGEDSRVAPFTLEGEALPFQRDGRTLVVATDAVTVPGIGFRTLALREQVAAGPQAGGRTSTGADEGSEGVLHSGDGFLENPYLRVEIGSDGTIHRVYDKESRREVLADRANQIWVYPDVPANFDAWDMDASYELEGQELVADTPPVLVRAGSVEAAIAVRRTWHDSTVEQEYLLTAASRRLEIRTRIDWHARRSMVRARFPVAVRSHEAWYETAFGAVARPTHRNTSWDAAKFEVPGHRWADLGEGDYGVSILTDSKYGYAVHDDTMSLTLLTSSVHPDPWADEGEHETTYALFPHRGTWRNGTVREAEALEAPMTAIRTSGFAGTETRISSSARLLSVDAPAIALAALKQAEDGDGVVLRVYEAHGTRGEARLEGRWKAASMEPLTVIEDHAEVADEFGGGFGYQPFQVSTFRLRLDSAWRDDSCE